MFYWTLVLILILINDIYCIEKQNKNITCANGEFLNVIGKTTIKIKLGGIERLVDFYIVREVWPKKIAGIYEIV